MDSYCDVCNVSLCRPCIGEHISDGYHKHTIVSFRERKSTLIYPKCRSHQQKNCKFQCKDCNDIFHLEVHYFCFLIFLFRIFLFGNVYRFWFCLLSKICFLFINAIIYIATLKLPEILHQKFEIAFTIILIN